MIGGISRQRILVATHPVDGRKSFNSLCGVVRNYFEEDPRSGSWYVFFNKGGNLIKVLYYDGNGYALWAKRLHQGVFRRPSGNQEKVEIDARALERIIYGLSEPDERIAA